jgi:DNA-binding beta-propeller fold protein YncE
MRTVLTAALFVVGVGVLAGCAGTTKRTGPSSLPSPFRITARFSARSLRLKNPRSLAIGPNGNLYVTDASQRITVISPSGKFIRHWGGPGSGRSQFRFVGHDPSDPNDINGKVTVGPDGTVYVSDGGNARVQVFTPQGDFVRQFGSFGSGRAQFLSPTGLAVDRDGNVYVVDDQPGTLSKFSARGKLIWRIGGDASADRDFVGLRQLLGSIDAHGRLVIANDEKGRILYVDRDGHKVDAFGSPERGLATSWACGATVDARGNTYVFECAPRNLIRVFDRTHRLIAEWSRATVGPPQFGPHGEVFALYKSGDDLAAGILKLEITLPGG